MNDLTRGNGLDTLFYLADCTSRRVSSYDVEGANDDWYTLQPGEIRELANIQGCGIIRHIWCTLLALYPKDMSNVPYYPRKIVLRTYWDGETSPSIEAPIGDFFGIGHGVLKEFCSEPLCMSPTDGRGLNCFFPMPFSDGARFTLQNETDGELHFFFYIDYEQHITLPPDCGRFHTQWRREKNTNGWMPVEPGYCFRPEFMDKERTWYTNHWKVKNLTGDDNYVILEARGKGKYVGCNLNIDQFEQQGNYWYGEGDDMIFIDGEPWPPRLHGTGTEDYFNTAFCPSVEFNTPNHGVTIYSGDKAGYPFGGKNSMYRFHIRDPIYFNKSIKVTIEHGHANKLSNDYSSTAYWYQTEPHETFPQLLPVEERLPREDSFPQPEEGSSK